MGTPIGDFRLDARKKLVFEKAAAANTAAQ
jgi:hypothetical protein